MLNEHDTELVLEESMRDSISFWERQGLDEREAFIKALNEITVMTSDPNSPHGEKLDEEIKNKFIKYRELDLGMRG
jgi:hypothetical protein